MESVEFRPRFREEERADREGNPGLFRREPVEDKNSAKERSDMEVNMNAGAAVRGYSRTMRAVRTDGGAAGREPSTEGAPSGRDTLELSGPYESGAQAAGNAQAAAKAGETAKNSRESGAEGTIYKPNTALVDQLKAEQESVQLKFLDTVRNMLKQQGITVAEGEGIWKQIAKGDYEVTPEVQAAAQDAISEDGYWGVKQTSERLIKFAKALTGGDPAQAEKMRDAFLKGFHEAEKAWGGGLPDITRETYDATMKLFDEWANESGGNAADTGSVSADA